MIIDDIISNISISDYKKISDNAYNLAKSNFDLFSKKNLFQITKFYTEFL